ncbi:hypothetical protein HRbin36_00408 [bacterium HR36]|nr:hypothetical protein HRbin36_00408 [bacterium HR36]
MLLRCPLCGQAFIAGGNPQAVALSPIHPVEPHRGGIILTLGIVVCGLFEAYRLDHGCDRPGQNASW